mmetsp:Transcript_9262/g.28414  ORF Transcript_9262/g.28414 Transcript_9262/m.28414 type:complete len:271 (-) Transcript_9262:320-1132(-)
MMMCRLSPRETSLFTIVSGVTMATCLAGSARQTRRRSPRRRRRSTFNYERVRERRLHFVVVVVVVVEEGVFGEVADGDGGGADEGAVEVGGGEVGGALDGAVVLAEGFVEADADPEAGRGVDVAHVGDGAAAGAGRDLAAGTDGDALRSGRVVLVRRRGGRLVPAEDAVTVGFGRFPVGVFVALFLDPLADGALALVVGVVGHAVLSDEVDVLQSAAARDRVRVGVEDVDRLARLDRVKAEHPRVVVQGAEVDAGVAQHKALRHGGCAVM